MILADTSIWTDHLRSADELLRQLLEDSRVLMHPLIIGDLACGNLRNRTTVVALLHNLPRATIATDREVLGFIEARRLMGRGLGYVDAHLLASVVLTPGAALWTRDRNLAVVAADLDSSACTPMQPSHL